MKEKFEKLESLLLKVHNPILDCSSDFPYVESEFLTVLGNLKLNPLEDLLELYRWNRGISPQNAFSLNFEYKLFTLGNHIDFRLTTSQLISDMNTNNIFKKKLLPFIYNGIYEDPILIDLSKESKTCGQIFYYSPEVTLSSVPVPIYDSIRNWIDTVIKCYETGVYRIDANGFLQTDGDKEAKIAREYNKKADFWSF